MSRIIKSSYPKFSNEEPRGAKVIGLKTLQHNMSGEKSMDSGYLNDQASQIIENAEQQAYDILQAAHIELQQARDAIAAERQSFQQEILQELEQAKQQGYNDGFEQGKNEGLNLYEQEIKNIQDLTVLAKKEYDHIVANADETIFQIGMRVAEKILDKHLENHQSDYVSLVKHAVKEVKEHRDVQIRVHPSQYELLISQKAELVSMLNYENDIYILIEEELTETDCLIDSSFGRIDASVDSQLKKIREKLIELLRDDQV
ncbi:flagellar assembly protein FliH [Bacillus sp. HMF5848]|uniref:flagellar assembly protein FliH n=1 Tax=Bacillus sp. HMF5848 TaxID=2495421 RepID=UPI000F76E6DB|nr:flagellar assembly protein FliH [Bacillus sp. HMF5848]RSK27027.1 flagellar assembly protein FliH [Bacillus sp. HMF5848]